MQQFHSLGLQIGGEHVHPGDVAVGSVETGDEAIIDRVTAADEDNRNFRGCGPGRVRGDVAAEAN